MKRRIGVIALLLALLLAYFSAACASELDELQGLLDALGGEEGATEEAGQPPEEALPDSAEPEPASADSEGVRQEDYPMMDGFSLATMNDTVAVQVPSAWGSNAGSSDVMVSYSPANHSGATDPYSSTLSTIWYRENDAGEGIMDAYVENLSKQDFFSNVQSEPATVAGKKGMTVSYDMTVGTNVFNCRTTCFVHDNILYSVEMYQGQMSDRDYFPVFEEVADSAAVMEGDWNIVSSAPETTAVPTAVPGQQPGTAPSPTAAVPTAAAPTAAAPTAAVPTAAVPTAAVPTSAPGQGAADLGDFTYTINGHAYQFPTEMDDLVQGDLDVDMSLVLSHEKDPAAEGNALANTLYFVLDYFPGRELIGVTNLTGENVPMAQGVLTAIVDTQAASVNLEIPGGLRIGSPEASIPGAFPEFAGRAMDGEGDYRGNELLYGCNVRSDGCNGYLIVRNDAPYCSALSIVCENGVIREINFQCLGAEVAKSIFD